MSSLTSSQVTAGEMSRLYLPVRVIDGPTLVSRTSPATSSTRRRPGIRSLAHIRLRPVADHQALLLLHPQRKRPGVPPLAACPHRLQHGNLRPQVPNRERSGQHHMDPQPGAVRPHRDAGKLQPSVTLLIRADAVHGRVFGDREQRQANQSTARFALVAPLIADRLTDWSNVTKRPSWAVATARR